jgi:tRNA U54 and U55 pseudouridine synthase Pus10
MMLQRSLAHIHCPIDLFEGCERKIERLTAAINHAPAPEEKGRRARQLLEAVATLLNCDAYDQNNLNCRLCRDFSTLRHKTASVIEKAAALGR